MTGNQIKEKFSKYLDWLYRHKFIFFVFILILTCYLVFFYQLGASPVRQWDESSLAVNSLEMSLNGNLLVKYLDGKPDLVNTKPPLAIWLIVASMNFFGYNEFALRFPSALAATITVFVIFIFATKYCQDLSASFLAVFVLITTIGFTGEHVARTGDYDSLLVLWITIYSVSFFLYLQIKKHQYLLQYLNIKYLNIYLAISTSALILAVMTKGIAGLLILPALLIYIAWQKQVRQIIMSPAIYYAGIIFFSLIIGYYLITEKFNPGYLPAIVENEITGRYRDLVPGGTPRGFLYYLVNIISYRFVPWIYLLPYCWVVNNFSQNKIIRDFNIFSFIYFTSYFLIISLATTKFNWYDAPLYPITSLTIGFGLAINFRLVIDFVVNNNLLVFNKSIEQLKISLKISIIYLTLIFSIFILPLLNNVGREILINNVTFRENDQGISQLALQYSKYFQKLSQSHLNIEANQLQVVNHYRYNLPLLFYVQVANLTSPYRLLVKWQYPSNNLFRIGEVLINCDPDWQKQLEKKYIMQILHTDNYCSTWLITNTKDF